MMGTADFRQVYRTKGKLGTLRHYGKKLLGKRWSPLEFGLASLVVGLRGDLATIDGCKFSLADPIFTSRDRWSFLLQYYEQDERYIMRLALDPHSPVIEMGGCYGVISCVTSKRMADPKRHIVLEANPRVIPILETNRALNGCPFRIVQAALAYGRNEVVLYARKDPVFSGLYETTEHTTTVPAIMLQSLMALGNYSGCNLISDIEGAESDLISNELELMAKQVRIYIAEFHPPISGETRVAEMMAALSNAGFSLFASRGNTYAFKNRAFLE